MRSTPGIPVTDRSTGESSVAFSSSGSPKSPTIGIERLDWPSQTRNCLIYVCSRAKRWCATLLLAHHAEISAMKWGSRQRHDGFDPWALTPLPRINRLTSTPARAKLRLKMLYGLPRCQTTGPCGWGCRRSSCRCRAAYPLFLYAVDRRDVSEARQRGTRGPSSPTRGVSVVGA